MAKAGIGFAHLTDVFSLYGSRGILALLAMPQDGVLRKKPFPRVTNNRKILCRIVKYF